jgi:hypothetical protein
LLFCDETHGGVGKRGRQTIFMLHSLNLMLSEWLSERVSEMREERRENKDQSCINSHGNDLLNLIYWL